MKKKLSLALFPMLILLIFLAACGSQPATTGQSSESPSATQAPSRVVHSGGCFARDAELQGAYDQSQDTNPPSWKWKNSPFFGAKFDSCLDAISMSWWGSYDFYQVRWSRPGLAEQQFSVKNSSGVLFKNAHFSTTYYLIAQGCNSSLFGSSCSAWSPIIHVATYYPGECHSGYVWRMAGPNDYVCASPASRNQAAYDNSQRYVRIDPNGAYGSQSCVQGYVWRNAFQGDLVCVLPKIRDEVATKNAAAYNNAYH